MPLSVRLGHRRRPGDRQRDRARRRAQGHRPGRRRHHQRRQHPPLLRADDRRAHDHADRRGDAHPDAPPHPGDAARRRADRRLPGADPRAAALARAARDRDAHDARARGVRRDARAALRGHHAPRPRRDAPTTTRCVVNGRYLMRPSPIPKFDNPKLDRNPALLLFGAGREKRIYAVPPYTSVRSLDFEDHPFTVETLGPALRALRRRPASSSTRSSSTTRAGGCSSAPTPTTASARRRRDPRERRRAPAAARARAHAAGTGRSVGCLDVGFDLWPGEVLGVVGESGSGKTTLLSCLSRARCAPTRGHASSSRPRDGDRRRRAAAAGGGAAPARRGPTGAIVHQNPRDGLRMGVTAGANVGERLMALGARHYGTHPRGGARLARPGRDRLATASTTCRRRSPAACSSGCRSPATS